MTPFYADDRLTVWGGDCLDVLPLLDAASIDSIVTDPPYGIGFMGHTWDQPGDYGPLRAGAGHSPGHPRERRAREAGSGVVTSMEAGRYDQSADARVRFQRWCEAWAVECLRVARPGAWLLTFGSPRSHHRLAVGLEDAGWELTDEIAWLFAQGMPKGRTTLKPAHEPIILARKPSKPVTPLQVDEVRIPFASAADERESKGKNQHTQYANPGSNRDSYSGHMPPRTDYDASGRWPANVVLTDPVLDPGTAEVVLSRRPASGFQANAQPETGAEQRLDVGTYSRYFLIPKANRRERNAGLEDIDERPMLWSSGTKSPGTFQSPGTKRAARNHHPTVKPAELMTHLVRLVTPPGGLVLDPFLGSGTTALAAVASGRRCVGIERDTSYLPLIARRLRLLRRDEVPA